MRSAGPSLGLLTLGMLGVVLLSALGIWQIERRTWKLALIERVEQRMHAAPTAPPPPSSWPAVTAAAFSSCRSDVRSSIWACVARQIAGCADQAAHGGAP